MSVCCICSSSNPKYKCPTCRAPYCSVACSKKHKEICGRSLPPSEPSKEPQISKNPFESFRKHKAIIDALADPRLQGIIARIDSSEDREQELVREMKLNPEFNAFVEELLSVAPSSITP